jgi:hypothetical protein
MGGLREQLAAALPEHEHKLLFYAYGNEHPPYNMLSILLTIKKFCSEVLPACPLVDPRNKRISIVKSNFAKLAGLEHRILPKNELSASDIIRSIENGSFNPEHFDSSRLDRLRTLFWIPEVLCDPDAIYRNAHKIVAGDEVYVRIYNKMGSKVKLVFTMDIKKGGRVIRTVPITSFLTDPETAISYVRGQPLYAKK